MDQERLSFMALHFIPGVGNILVKHLISYCGSAEEVFRQSQGRLLKIPGIGAITAESIRKGKAFSSAERELRKAGEQDIQILFYTDKAYPQRLRSIDDAPSMLYVKGNVNLNCARTVAMVGTRQATSYGKEQVEKLVEAIAPFQALVISGLAYGIDIHAHKQALKHGLMTVGVLGSGLDIIYPAGHKDIAGKMINQGGLISENFMGTSPDAHNFPARNRIIAGMCDALIVVEAAERGGALITAEIANSYNKDVFAIPGNVGQQFSEGCNKLIKTHKASLLTSSKDLEYIMNWTQPSSTKSEQLALELTELEPEERLVMNALASKNNPLFIDELATQTGLSSAQLSALLLSLEFKNAVISMPGKMYRRK